MAHERLVFMNVVDDAGYARYRAAMRPILQRFGGSFRHDFKIAETLTTDAPHPVTRVFVIAFPDAGAAEKFFADPEYAAVRARHYEDSVNGHTVYCEHDR